MSGDQQQQAMAAGCAEGWARPEYRQCADGQYQLWRHYGGRLGLEYSDGRLAAGFPRPATSSDLEPDRSPGQ